MYMAISVRSAAWTSRPPHVRHTGSGRGPVRCRSSNGNVGGSIIGALRDGNIVRPIPARMLIRAIPWVLAGTLIVVVGGLALLAACEAYTRRAREWSETMPRRSCGSGKPPLRGRRGPAISEATQRAGWCRW